MFETEHSQIKLTARERELMRFIARGMQNKTIAHELRISENTVRAHVGNIMRKCHLTNRTQLAVLYTRDLTQLPNAGGEALPADWR